VTIPRLTRDELALLDAVADLCRRHGVYMITWNRHARPRWTLQSAAEVPKPDAMNGVLGIVDLPDYRYVGQTTPATRARMLRAEADALEAE